MENIIRLINNSIEAAQAIPFEYGGAEELNVVLARTTFPCAIGYLVNNSQVVEDGRMIKERLNIALFWIDKTNYDSDSLENEDIIHQCRERCFKWLAMIREKAQAYGIKVSTPTNSQRIYDTFDDIVTGYGITVSVEEIYGITACDNIEVEPQEQPIVNPVVEGE